MRSPLAEQKLTARELTAEPPRTNDSTRRKTLLIVDLTLKGNGNNDGGSKDGDSNDRGVNKDHQTHVEKYT